MSKHDICKNKDLVKCGKRTFVCRKCGTEYSVTGGEVKNDPPRVQVQKPTKESEDA